jgi:hypothetical protein
MSMKGGDVPDDVGPAELDRRLRDHEARTDRAHAEIDNRISRVSAESVQVSVWQLAERAHVAEATRLEREHATDLAKLKEDVIKPLRERIEAVEKRPWLTTGRIVVIATAVIALAALLVQAYGTLKGAR